MAAYDRRSALRRGRPPARVLGERSEVLAKKTNSKTMNTLLRRTILVLTVAALLLPATDAAAQLFGTRTLGKPLNRRARPSAEDVGEISGNERFLRGNRPRNVLVGRDLQGRQSFVGEQRGTIVGQVPSSIANARVQQRRDANVPVLRTNELRRGVYEPRLVVDFDYQSLPTDWVERDLTRMINASKSIFRQGRIDVTLDDRRATIQGVVASERDRRLAEDLIRLEPGVSEVANQLRVRPSEPSPLP